MALSRREPCTGSLSALANPDAGGGAGWRCDCGSVFHDPLLAAEHCRGGDDAAQ